MRNLNTLTFHPTAERIVDAICQKTTNSGRNFFRVLLSYHLTKMASTMRVKIATRFIDTIPINVFAFNFAPSGFDKGYSTGIIENQIAAEFQRIFIDETFPVVVDENLAKLAVKRATINNEDPDAVLAAVTREFKELGALLPSFDSATTPAIKQLRTKLLMGKIGAMNLEIDEIGSNLSGNIDALTTYLELFDVGTLKQKLTKNTKDSVRSEEILGRTPANLMAFGTPTAVFDGGKTEEDFYRLLDTGFARRCIFGYERSGKEFIERTGEEEFDNLTDTTLATFIKNTSKAFSNLANIVNYNKHITVSKDVSIHLLDYKIHCQKLATDMGNYEVLARAEMSHRYFKALKLAGTYAFMDGHAEITEDNLYAAICMIEESGKAFQGILNRERNYVKLAKYLADTRHEVTHVDIAEDLPFYNKSQSARQDLLNNAVAWGYKNHIIIKKEISNGIEFISGETLQKTDLEALTLSYSTDISDGYKNVNSQFTSLHLLVQQNDKHWITHHSTNGHRDEEHMAPGFDMVVLDIDKGTKIKEVMSLLKEYKFLLHTTKRHTPADHRFRVILPLDYHLKLSAEDFKEFMKNIIGWLPFGINTDTNTHQRSRKWQTCKGQYKYNTGTKLLDAQLFIPKTSKGDERQNFVHTYQSLTNLERWFVQNSVTGDRNNQLFKYAAMLVDMGYSYNSVMDSVISMNNKLPDKLTLKEITDTIMKSTNAAINSRAAA